MSNEAIFELVFFLVILKIPIVYLCGVVWWAIRAEPRPPEGAARLVPAPPAEPGPARWWRRRGVPRPGPVRPHGGPSRGRRRREAFARARVEP